MNPPPLFFYLSWFVLACMLYSILSCLALLYSELQGLVPWLHSSALSCFILLSFLVLSCFVLSYFIMSCPYLPCPVHSYHTVFPYLYTLPCLILLWPSCSPLSRFICPTLLHPILLCFFAYVSLLPFSSDCLIHGHVFRFDWLCTDFSTFRHLNICRGRLLTSKEHYTESNERTATNFPPNKIMVIIYVHSIGF